MLEDLKKSISEMTDEELHEHLRDIRKSSVTPKASGVARAAKAAKNNEPTKVSVGTLINAMSAEDKAKLLKELMGG